MRNFKHVLFKSQREDRQEPSLTGPTLKRQVAEQITEAEKKFSTVLPRPQKQESKMQAKLKRAVNETPPTQYPPPTARQSHFEKSGDAKMQKRKSQAIIASPMENRWGAKAAVMRIFSNSFKGVNSETNRAFPTPIKPPKFVTELYSEEHSKLSALLSLKKPSQALLRQSLEVDKKDITDKQSNIKAVAKMFREHAQLILDEVPKKSSSFAHGDVQTSLQNSHAKTESEPVSEGKQNDNFCTKFDSLENVKTIKLKMEENLKTLRFASEMPSKEINIVETTHVLSALGFFDSENASELFRTADDNMFTNLVWESLKGVGAEETKVNYQTLIASLSLLRVLEQKGVIKFRKHKRSQDVSLNGSLSNQKRKSTLSNRSPIIIKKGGFSPPIQKVPDERLSIPAGARSNNGKSPTFNVFSTGESPYERPQKDFDQYDCSQFTFKKPKKESFSGDGLTGTIEDLPNDNQNENDGTRVNRAITMTSIDLTQSSKFLKQNRAQEKEMGVRSNSEKLFCPRYTFKAEDPDAKDNENVQEEGETIDRSEANVFQAINIQTKEIRKPLFTLTITFNSKKLPLEIFEEDDIPTILQRFTAEHNIGPERYQYLLQVLEEQKSEKLKQKQRNELQESKV